MSFSKTLRHKLSIQRRADGGSDDDGQPIEAWAEVAAPYADIRSAGGLETIRGGAVSSIVKVSIRIRYRRDITSGMRAVHGTTVYNILAALPDEQKRVHTDLVCEVIS